MRQSGAVPPLLRPQRPAALTVPAKRSPHRESASVPPQSGGTEALFVIGAALAKEILGGLVHNLHQLAPREKADGPQRQRHQRQGRLAEGEELIGIDAGIVPGVVGALLADDAHVPAGVPLAGGLQPLEVDGVRRSGSVLHEHGVLEGGGHRLDLGLVQNLRLFMEDPQAEGQVLFRGGEGVPHIVEGHHLEPRSLLDKFVEAPADLNDAVLSQHAAGLLLLQQHPCQKVRGGLPLLPAGEGYELSADVVCVLHTLPPKL